MLRALSTVLAAHRVLWLALAAGFVLAYHALLLGAMVLRFQHLPNFVKVYDIVDGYRLTLAGTPSLRDAVPILLGEPWLDVGYLSPQWNMAEWSLMILPPQLALVTLLGCLLATFAVLVYAARKKRCSFKSAALAAAIGTGLAGMANATLFWVVCCATPTWIVGLAMLGVSVSIAFMLEPLGPLLTAGGVALLTAATLAQLKTLAAAPATPRFSLFLHNGVPEWPSSRP